MTEPEEPAEQETFAFPADSMGHIADLLGELDAFLRSGHPIGDQLTEFMRHRGRPHPGLAACNLIDDLCFTAFSYRRFADELLGQPTTALFADEQPSAAGASKRPGTVVMVDE
jgi:hypothetical protein